MRKQIITILGTSPQHISLLPGASHKMQAMYNQKAGWKVTSALQTWCNGETGVTPTRTLQRFIPSSRLFLKGTEMNSKIIMSHLW